MREIWYGDRRDIVKWSAVKEIAERAQTKEVVQVLFYKPSMLCVRTTDPNQPSVEKQIPVEVYRHLRLDLSRAVDLGEELDLTVTLIDDPFERKKQTDGALWARAYIGSVVTAIAKRAKLVVFLDPDTGIEPEKPDATHVTVREVNAIWRGMTAKMWLLFYQHRPRGAKGDTWIADKRDRVAEALVEPAPTEVVTITAEDIAKDVAFFAAQKP